MKNNELFGSKAVIYMIRKMTVGFMIRNLIDHTAKRNKIIKYILPIL